MFEIKGARILLTKGDCAVLRVEMTREFADGSREAYTMQPTDTLTLTAKKNRLCKTEMLQLVSVGETALMFRPEDTKELPSGEYIYDIEMKTADGQPYTVIGQGMPGMDATLVILDEVTA